MPSTFQLVGDAEKVALLLDESGGELTEEAEAAIEEFLEASGDKLAGIRAARLHLEKRSELYKEETERFREARKKTEAALERVNGYALSLLKSRTDLGEMQKHEGDGFSARINKSRKIGFADGCDLHDVPGDYEVVMTRLDKKKAAADMRDGLKISGLVWIETETVVWR